MIGRSRLTGLVREVADELAADEPGVSCIAAAVLLESHLELVLDLIDRLIAETHKKRPQDAVVAALLLLIRQAFESIRLAADARDEAAVALADAVRARLLEVGTAGQVEAPLLMELVRGFAAAGLDPGRELRDLMGSALEQAAAAGADGPESLRSAIDEIVGVVGDDVFAVHGQLREFVDPLPPEHRAALGIGLLQSDQGIAREAALGWLCDPAARVRETVATTLVEAAQHGAVSATMLRRLIALRHWLPETERPAIARAIEACRQSAVGGAAWPQPRRCEPTATGIDGSGSQSLFVQVAEGRRQAFAALLGRHGDGIRDGWVQRGLRRSEAKEMLSTVESGLELFPTTAAFARLAAEHFLAANLARGVVPPFAALDFFETVGLADPRPNAVALGQVLDMLAAAPDPGGSAAAAAPSFELAADRNLPKMFDFLDSWFEPEVEAMRVLPQKALPRSQRVARVRDVLLPEHAARWAELTAWTALTLRSAEGAAPWQDFFVAATKLAGGHPMREIPLMQHVAEQTVGVFEASRGRSRR